MDDIVERLRARAMKLDWATVPTDELEQAADEIERLREDAHYNKGCCKLAMKHRDEAEAEVERLRILVRIPLAVHNQDAAEYVERLRKGDIHAADYEPIAELMEQLGEAQMVRKKEVHEYEDFDPPCADAYSSIDGSPRWPLPQKEGE